ncbi:MAG: hypothetical protein U0Q16_28460 [Bryobacteraceae bacterium]
MPVKASEAAALADLIIQQLDGRAITDDQRNRLAARAAALELVSIRPFWGSLQQDPIHASTYYLAVDGTNPISEPSGPQPLLLRVALASAPASALFPKAILIGRMRPGGGREVVVNAIPFSPEDATAIATFATKVDTAFQPRAHGPQSAITIATSDPAQIAAAFDAFRAIHKNTGANLASFEAPLSACIQGAVRAGWRLGYGAATRIASTQDAAISQGYSRYVVDAPTLEAHIAIYDAIRARRAELALPRAFDYELVNPADPADWLAQMKSSGRPVQLLAAPPTGAEIARHASVTLSITADRADTAEILRDLAHQTAGRWNYLVTAATQITPAAEHLRRT